MLGALETRLPPPVLLLLLGTAVWWAERAAPQLGFHLRFARSIGLALMLAGLALNLWPKRAFGRAGTTVNPLSPQSSTRLLTGGVYRHTRNPMYLGYVVLLAGWGVWLQTFALFAVLLVQVAWLTRLQIVPEERALRVRFGAAYREYCQRVRRWL